MVLGSGIYLPMMENEKVSPAFIRVRKTKQNKTISSTREKQIRVHIYEIARRQECISRCEKEKMRSGGVCITATSHCNKWTRPFVEIGAYNANDTVLQTQQVDVHLIFMLKIFLEHELWEEH